MAKATEASETELLTEQVGKEEKVFSEPMEKEETWNTDKFDASIVEAKTTWLLKRRSRPPFSLIVAALREHISSILVFSSGDSS